MKLGEDFEYEICKTKKMKNSINGSDDEQRTLDQAYTRFDNDSDAQVQNDLFAEDNEYEENIIQMRSQKKPKS